MCTSQLHQILLFLLIWGEAANLRFLPEMLCFVFYCASNALVLEPTEVGNVDPESREAKAAYKHGTRIELPNGTTKIVGDDIMLWRHPDGTVGSVARSSIIDAPATPHGQQQLTVAEMEANIQFTRDLEQALRTSAAEARITAARQSMLRAGASIFVPRG